MAIAVLQHGGCGHRCLVINGMDSDFFPEARPLWRR